MRKRATEGTHSATPTSAVCRTHIVLSELALSNGDVASAHTVEQYGDVESELHSFSTSTLEGGQRSTERSEPRAPLARGVQNWARHFGENKNLLLVSGIESRPAQSAVACARPI